jgi:hypothetical protein
MWNDYKTIHAIGCGPSVKPWLEQLKAKPNMVCVNSMGPVIGNPRHWVMVDPIVDSRILGWSTSDQAEQTTMYCTKHNQVQLPLKAKLIKVAGTRVMGDPDKDGYFMLRSSLMVACHVAWRLGAERVVVWGLDMNDHVRVNGDCGEPWQKVETINEGWRRLRAGLKDLACDVFNANPKSGVRELEFIDPQTAIGE